MARVWKKSSSSSPNQKLFAIFSFIVNVCNWNFFQLLPEHISASLPILIHLHEYLYELYHFLVIPLNFDNLIMFITKFTNFH